MQNASDLSPGVDTARRQCLRYAAGTCAGWWLGGCGGGGTPASKDLQQAGALALQAYGSWASPVEDLYADLGFLHFPSVALRALQGQTLRQVAHLSLGGQGLRLQLSNSYGKSVLALQGVHVALSLGADSIDPASDHAVHFAGQTQVQIAPGALAWSDPVPLEVADGADVAVSLYLQQAADGATVHRFPLATQYVVPGNALQAAHLTEAAPHSERYWLSAIDVYRPQRCPVLATFGDSLSDGVGSSPRANHRYSDYLAQRLSHRAAVVNAGLAGNRWLHDAIGLRGVERWWRDVLGISGLSHAIVQMGANDICFHHHWRVEEEMSLDALCGAMRSAVVAGQAAGVQLYLGTLAPFKGHWGFVPEDEVVRQAVNAWVRQGEHGAEVLDFDAALRDPSDPAALHPAYRWIDALHLNDQGYQRMADVVPLARIH